MRTFAVSQMWLAPRSKPLLLLKSSARRPSGVLAMGQSAMGWRMRPPSGRVRSGWGALQVCPWSLLTV